MRRENLRRVQIESNDLETQPASENEVGLAHASRLHAQAEAAAERSAPEEEVQALGTDVVC